MDRAGIARGRLFSRQCIQCDSDPVCNCTADQQCILTSRTCSQCPTIQCIAKPTQSSKGGVNPGVIAGPVVAVLIAASLALFWWLRKKKRRDLERLEDLAKRARKAESAGFQLSHPGSPVPGSAHSHSQSMRSYRASQLPQPPHSASRRSAKSPLPPAQVNAEYYDENGANIRVYAGNGTINLDPKHPDPFSDGKSVSTYGSSTHSTNIIPIHYIPPVGSEDGPSQAARTLDEARQNLFQPRSAPRRPARSPDLDLRLNPPSRNLLSPNREPLSGRDSFLSEKSAAPSFLSGNSYDVHNDAPKIVTSRQVQIGRLHQAEVVQFGRNNGGGGVGGGAGDPFNALGVPGRQVERAASPATFGARSLTPASPRRYEDLEEGLDETSSGNSTDLRFSMGSLQYRDSISTMGTGRHPVLPDPTTMAAPRGQFDGPRESMFSTKSYADSVLSGFPMITPNQSHGLPPMPHPMIPQSTSNNTLDHVAGPSRPPPSFKAPKGSYTQSNSRQVSVADSFLGSFPFVPPNMDDLAELPSAALPSAAVPDTANART